MLAVDDALSVETPHELSTAALKMGVATEDAGRIDVPVYICLGGRDVSPDRHAEPACYSSSKDVTRHVLPGAAHCQAFATTRMEMVERIDGWIRGIAW